MDDEITLDELKALQEFTCAELEDVKKLIDNMLDYIQSADSDKAQEFTRRYIDIMLKTP